MPRRIFLTVAEASGDQHAAELVARLRELDPAVIIEGHGGPRMRAAGVHIHHETITNARMGFGAIVRFGEMYRLLKWTKRYFETNKPDLLICIDSPAVNLAFAKAARQRGVKVLYYIPPQLWAWRIQRRRMRMLEKWTDRVACILPFEEDYFKSRGVHATYVGHPLFDAMPADRGPAPQGKYPHREPVIGLLGGSRRAEVAHNFPHILEVAQKIRQAFPKASFVAPTTTATHEQSREMAARLAPELSVNVSEDAFEQLVPQCDLCITKSGTSTLHVAAFAVPMIVVYRGNWLLYHTLGRLLVATRIFSLVNILAGQADGYNPKMLQMKGDQIVPEFIPWHGSNQPVADCAIGFLKSPETLAAQRRQLLQIIKPLDKSGASRNTAQMALGMIG